MHLNIAPTGLEITEITWAPGYGLSRDGRAWSKMRGPWRELRLSREYQSLGYRMVVLRVNGRQKRVFLHTLMLRVFVGPRPSHSHQGRHMDGNFLNNAIDNLKWGTPQDNADDRSRHGRTRKGSSHPMAKLNDDDIVGIRLMLASGFSGVVISELYGVTPTSISSINTGRFWTHV